MRITPTLALALSASLFVAACGQKEAEAPAEGAAMDNATEEVPASESDANAADANAIDANAAEGEEQTGGNEKK